MIGILIVAHDTLGESLIRRGDPRARQPAAAIRRARASPRPTTRCNLLPQARELVAALDNGDGVLILTDIYGATPCNLAGKLLARGRVEGVAGRQPADAGARAHLPRQGHGDDGDEGRSAAAATACCTSSIDPDLCSNGKLRSSTSSGCMRAPSAKLTQLAGKYQCEVWMARNGRRSTPRASWA